jgi:hypothetical protein
MPGVTCDAATLRGLKIADMAGSCERQIKQFAGMCTSGAKSGQQAEKLIVASRLNVIDNENSVREN